MRAACPKHYTSIGVFYAVHPGSSRGADSAPELWECFIILLSVKTGLMQQEEYDIYSGDTALYITLLAHCSLADVV